MRISLKAINSELERRAYHSMLARGDDYFYFWGGEAADWLDRTVRVPTLHSLTLDQWVQEFETLREQNRKLMESNCDATRGKSIAGCLGGRLLNAPASPRGPAGYLAAGARPVCCRNRMFQNARKTWRWGFQAGSSDGIILPASVPEPCCPILWVAELVRRDWGRKSRLWR